MSEFVFILGAGASKKAGAPVMSDFLSRAEKLFKGKPVYESVAKARSLLQAAHSKSDLDLENLESVFSAFEMARLINYLPGFDGSFDKLLDDFKTLIAATLEQSILFPFKDGKPRSHPSLDEFARVIQRLEGRSPERSCSILTFNYDLAIDMALTHRSIPFDYYLGPPQNSRALPLLKLHGSLNWLLCGDRVPTLGPSCLFGGSAVLES